MKRILFLSFAAIFLTGASPDESIQSSVLKKVAQRSEMVRANREIQLMQQSIAVLCSPVTIPVTPHAEAYFDISVSPEGRAPLQSGVGKYPVGSVIIKTKYTDPFRQDRLLFTGMRKHEVGYKPEVGDWEFFMANGAGVPVRSPNGFSTCIACHQAYAKTDYVTRDYDLTGLAK